MFLISYFHPSSDVNPIFIHSSPDFCFLHPAIRFITLVHLDWGVPLVHIRALGLHSTIRVVHRLPLVLPICPAQFHYNVPILCITADTFDLRLISVLCIQSCSLMLSFLPSIACCYL